MLSTLSKIWVFALALVLPFHTTKAQQAAADPELAALLLAYKTRVSTDIKNPLAKAQAELSQNYIQALDRAQQDATLKARLEEAMAFRAEKEAVVAGGASDLPLLPPKIRELATLRKKYLDAVQLLRSGMFRKLEPLQKEMVRQLDALAVRMVRAGKTDAALEARQIAKGFAEQPLAFEEDWQDQTLKVTPPVKNAPIVLKKRDTITTLASFKPPVDIEVVVKIESLDLRLGYAAKEMIFNWEKKPDELRMDGGPADKIYTPLMGELPQKKFVVIRWNVTKEKQTVQVDGQLRFEHKGDYSSINRPITIFAYGSEATVQSIRTRQPVIP